MASERVLGQPPPKKRSRISSYPANNGQPQQRNGHPHQQQQQRPTSNHQNQQRAVAQPFSHHRLLQIVSINLLSQEVQQFIYNQCALSENVEIEAKLGKLLTFVEANPGMSDNTEQKTDGEEMRVHDKIGLKSIGWVDLHKTGGHFESTVSAEVFKHLNTTFNGWYANCNATPDKRVPELQNIAFPKMLYKRSRTVDKIYRHPDHTTSTIRVTIDMANPTRIKEVIEKKKKASMNICYPSSKFDIRISASVENVVPTPKGQIVSSLRCKDRISYEYDYFSVDITSTYTYSEGLTQQFINEVIDKFKNKRNLPLDRCYGTLRTYEVEFEIANHKHLKAARDLASKEKKFYELQAVSYFFIQGAIQLAQVATNLNYKPLVCKLPPK